MPPGLAGQAAWLAHSHHWRHSLALAPGGFGRGVDGCRRRARRLVKQVSPIGTLPHLVAGGWVDQRLLAVPATAKCLVKVDQIANGVAAIDQIGVLLGEQCPLGIEHALEVGVPLLEQGVGQRQRAFRLVRGLTQDFFAFECLEQAAGGIVGLEIEEAPL